MFEFYTKTPDSTVDIGNTILVTSRLDISGASIAGTTITGGNAIGFMRDEAMLEYQQSVFFRNTDNFGSVLCLLWLHDDLFDDEQIYLEALNSVHFRIEAFLASMNEPTANPDFFAIAGVDTDDAIAGFDLQQGDDTLHHPALGKKAFHELSQYISSGFSVISFGDFTISEADLERECVGTKIYRKSDGKLVANLWESDHYGSVMSIAHHLFSDWLTDNNFTLDDYAHSPYLKGR